MIKIGAIKNSTTAYTKSRRLYRLASANISLENSGKNLAAYQQRIAADNCQANEEQNDGYRGREGPVQGEQCLIVGQRCSHFQSGTTKDRWCDESASSQGEDDHRAGQHPGYAERGCHCEECVEWR